LRVARPGTRLALAGELKHDAKAEAEVEVGVLGAANRADASAAASWF
jgi:hypothetical protein